MLTGRSRAVRLACAPLLCWSCVTPRVAAHPGQDGERAPWIAAAPPRLPVPRAEIKGESAVVRLDKPALDAVLRDAPREDPARRDAGVVIALPMPDGTFARFRVVESPMVAPELAAKFPEIRTYTGQGLDDRTATTRFGWTPEGFHAIVIGIGGSVYIDRYSPSAPDYYVSYRKAQ